MTFTNREGEHHGYCTLGFGRLERLCGFDRP